MNITFAQKIGLISSGVAFIIGGAFVYAQVVEPTEDPRRLLSEQSNTDSILGKEESVGRIVSMEEQIKERESRYNIQSSFEGLSSTQQKEASESLQNLSNTYKISLTSVSNFPGGVFPWEESINYILANMERVEIPSEVVGGDPTVEYRYNPLPSTGETIPEQVFPFSLNDTVETLVEKEIEGLDLNELEEAMVEIVTIIVNNLGESEFPLDQIINNPNLRNLILAQIGLDNTLGSGIPPITIEMLGLDTLDLLDDLDPETIKTLSYLAELYPQILGFTRNPEEALKSLALEYLPIESSIQEIINALSPEELLIRLKNEAFGQILAGFVVQIPIFEFAPCGEKLLPNSPKRYSPAIPMCSLCKRYCATKTFGFFGGSITYHSYLFGNGKCGCDPAPGASSLPF